MTATQSVVMCGCGKPAAIIHRDTGMCVQCFARTVNQLFKESSARKQQQIVNFAHASECNRKDCAVCAQEVCRFCYGDIDANGDCLCETL